MGGYFTSYALRRDSPDGILKYTSRQLSPISRDTGSWVYASNVRERCLREVFVGNITGWHRNGIMKELLVELWRLR
ncbi:MAG: hypothetical protein V3T23_06585 [Nitrososphaerales archaeon]